MKEMGSALCCAGGIGFAQTQRAKLAVGTACEQRVEVAKHRVCLEKNSSMWLEN